MLCARTPNKCEIRNFLPGVHLHHGAIHDGCRTRVDCRRIVRLVVPDAVWHVRPLCHVFGDCVAVGAAAVQADVVLVVEMVHTVHWVVAWAVRVVFAARRILDVKLRRVLAKRARWAYL